MQGAIDTTRLAATVEAAKRLGEPLLHVEEIELPGEASNALEWFARADDPALDRSLLEHPSGLFFWRARERWVLGLGASLDESAHASELADSNLEQVIQRWREQHPSLPDVHVVGGFAFDGSDHREEGYWRGYHAAHVWVPEIMFVGEDSKITAIVTTKIDPGQTYENALTRVGSGRTLLQQWLAADAPAIQPPESPTEARPGAFHEPFADAWGDLVDQAVDTMRESDMDKVVLARPIDYSGSGDIELVGVLAYLIASYPSCRVFAISPPSTKGNAATPVFVGATPECLVRMDRQETIHVDALAGTIPSDTPDHVLLESSKDRHEHQLVIDAIRESLEDVADLNIPDTPSVDELANVKHLRTSIQGTLKRRATLLGLAARLHPTPAICGKPRALARRWIAAHEQPLGMTRGWYTGAIGWTRLGGDGEWDVALRCASIDGPNARLYVGAGVVEGSTGSAELAETRQKGRALEQALVACEGGKRA